MDDAVTRELRTSSVKPSTPSRCSKCRVICRSLTMTYSTWSALEACSIRLAKSSNESLNRSSLVRNENTKLHGKNELVPKPSRSRWIPFSSQKSLLSLLAGGAFARAPGGSGDNKPLRWGREWIHLRGEFVYQTKFTAWWIQPFA